MDNDGRQVLWFARAFSSIPDLDFTLEDAGSNGKLNWIIYEKNKLKLSFMAESNNKALYTSW